METFLSQFPIENLRLERIRGDFRFQLFKSFKNERLAMAHSSARSNEFAGLAFGDIVTGQKSRRKATTIIYNMVTTIYVNAKLSPVPFRA